jgi:hypothetical protein
MYIGHCGVLGKIKSTVGKDKTKINFKNKISVGSSDKATAKAE